MNTREPEKRKKKESYFCQVSVVLTYKTHTSDFRMKQSSCTSAPSGRQGHTKADLMDRLLLCVHTQICHMLHKRCCSQQYCQHGTTRDQTPDSPSQHSIEPQKQEPPHRRKNSVTDMDNGLASRYTLNRGRRHPQQNVPLTQEVRSKELNFPLQPSPQQPTAIQPPSVSLMATGVAQRKPE